MKIRQITKKALAIVLTFVLVLSLPLCINAATVNTAVTGEIKTGSCGADGDNVTYTLDTETGVLTISGTGDMADYSYGGAPWWGSSDKYKVTSVVISDGVTSIGEYTFCDLTRLTSIEIPETVTCIGKWAFFICTALTSIVIPEGVTSIEDYAFHTCESLTSVVISEGVTSIGQNAFYDCRSLTSINIPSSVTSIAEWAFYDCSGLTSIEIPEGVTSIGKYAFSSCTGLTSIEIPEGVTSIAEGTLMYCNGLTSIIIPEGVTSIGQNAFYSCRSLTSINIPSSVTSILGDAFHFCDKLTQITVDEKNQNYCSVDGLLLDKGKTTLVTCPGGKTTAEIPESVTSIGDFAFAYCNDLTSIVIPKNVTSIGGCAFVDCSSLTSVVIPKSVTSIEDSAFEACSQLKSAYIYNKDIQFKYYNVFKDTASDFTIYGYKDSTAQTYAEKNSHNFVAFSEAELKATLVLSYNNGQADGEFNYDSDYTVSFSELSAPQKDNSVFTGWYLDSECTISAGSQVTVLKGEKKTLYAGWRDVGDTLEAEADDDMSYVGTTSEFDLFGAQFRGQTDSYTTGLRFCTRVSKSLISEIEAKTGSPAESGYVICKKDNIPQNTEFTVGMTTTKGKVIKENPAPVRYYDGESYYVYTAVIVNIPDNMQSTDIVARPYIKYTDANGILRYYYFTESGESNCGGGYYTSYTAVYNAYLATQ